MTRLYQLLVVFLLALSTPVIGQVTTTTTICDTSSLYGQILSADPDKSLPGAQILAKRVGDKAVIGQEESHKGWYCVKVPTFTRVFLFFQSDGYEPQSTDVIDTGLQRKRHSWPISVIKLDPIAFGQREAHQQSPKQKRQRIRAKLNKHKESLSSTGPNDIFVWNIELFKEAYREDPDATAEINQFLLELKADPEFYFLETTEYIQKSKLFRFIIACNQGRLVESDVKPEELISLIESSPTFSGIRANAIRTLSLLNTLTPANKEQAMAALTKALEQDGSVAVRTKAAEVLGSIGDQPEVLTALRRAAQEDESPEVKSAAGVAAELVARRPTGVRLGERRTEVVNNADGTWTVVEYPVGKEVIVNLTPTTIPNATGTAKILRMANGTMINVELTGLSNAINKLNLYAIDPTGRPTLLSPVTVTNGAATLSTTTTLDKFMLVLSPEANLTTITPQANVAMRSAVPPGFAVVPLASMERDDGSVVGERVSAVSTSGTTTSYTAPFLNIPGMKRGEGSMIKVIFTGALTGARANIKIEPRKDGLTVITARFYELKDAPAGQVYVLWAVGANNKYVRIEQIAHTGVGYAVEIRSHITLRDFGLFLTLEEEKDLSAPRGTVVGMFFR